MNILIAHNSYRYRGGEDAVVEAETELLRSHGHSVRLYQRHNDELCDISAANAAVDAVWSRRSVKDMAELCAGFRPDVLHVHNTFPLISPAVYWTARQHGVPVVQTLHNFRFLCPQGSLSMKGQSCERCVGKAPWRAAVHKCYRDSHLQSAVSSSAVIVHRGLGTYRQCITPYIALNAWCRDKFIEGGLPPERVKIKPNFVSDWPSVDGARKGGLFIGRLTEEKGLAVLIEACAKLGDIEIKVAGEGPLQSLAGDVYGRRYLGYLSPAAAMDAMAAAEFLIVPSCVIEPFGLVVIEAFSRGTPVIASRQGGLQELVRDGVTGLLVPPSDPRALADAMAWAAAHPEEMRKMGQAARTEYESRYTPERNYAMLLDIYRDAMSICRERQRAA